VISKIKARELSVKKHLKSIIEVKAETNCLAHGLIKAIAKVTNDPDYKAYCQGRKTHPVVQTLLERTGINLYNDAGIPNTNGFKTISINI
jgi:hypothetical protein